MHPKSWFIAALHATLAFLLLSGLAAPAEAAVRFVPSSASVQSDGRGVENAAWIAGQGQDGIEIQTARRKVGGRWSRPATLAKQRSVGARPGIWGLRTDAAGTGTLFWTLATPGSTGDELFLARRPVGGAWSKPELAPMGTPAGIRLAAADTTVGVSSDGTTTMVWCAYRAAPTQVPAAGAGLLSRTRTAAGEWGPVVRVFASVTEYCNSPRLAVSQAGDVAVTWWGSSFQGFAFRPAGGDWAESVPVAAAGRPIFSIDGRVHVIGGSGNTPSYTAFDGAGKLLSSSLMPEPSTRETFNGRRGAGQLMSMTMGFTKARAPVLVWNRLGSTNPVFRQRPRAAIFTALRIRGRWVLRPVDALGAVDGQGGFDLASDDRGTPIATWYGESRGRKCRLKTPVFRAALSKGGRWGRRYLVGYRASGATDCEPPKVWTPELNAFPQAFTKPRAAVKTKIAARTKTVAAVLKAKGLAITCRAAAAGFCTAGITSVSPSAAWSLLDAKCLVTGARTTTDAAGRAKTIRLAFKKACKKQLKAAIKPGRPLVLTVVATTDVVGRRSGTARLKIRLAR